ncbi:MAG: hypothetical protein QXZ59_05905 [Nitrososphaeria archaeon]
MIMTSLDLFLGKKLKVKGIILLKFVPKSPKQVVEKIVSILSYGFKIEGYFLIVREDSVRLIPLR